MADFASISTRDVPHTPTKGGITSSVSEVTETPAPAYGASVSNNDHISTLDGVPKLLSKFMQAGAGFQHPINPDGNVTSDLRNHLPCHKNFNSNVDVIIFRYNQLKKDYDQALHDLGAAQRQVRREKEQKEAYKLRCEQLEIALRDSQDDHQRTKDELRRVQAELFDLQTRLDSAIRQLAEAVQKLEQTRNALREMTKERDHWKLRSSELEAELKWYTDRVVTLQKALDIANEGENAANDRNARLTIMLFQIEAQKADIEREKDLAQALVRNLQDELREFPGSGRGRVIEQQLRLEISRLEKELETVQMNLDKANGIIDVRNVMIQEQERLIKDLGDEKQRQSGEIKKLEQSIKAWTGTVDHYERLVGNLKNNQGWPHRNCYNEYFTKYGYGKIPLVRRPDRSYISNDSVEVLSDKSVESEGEFAIFDVGANPTVDSATTERVRRQLANSEPTEDGEITTTKEPETTVNKPEMFSTGFAPVTDGEPVVTAEEEKPATETEASTNEDGTVDSNTDA